MKRKNKHKKKFEGDKDGRNDVNLVVGQLKHRTNEGKKKKKRLLRKEASICEKGGLLTHTLAGETEGKKNKTKKQCGLRGNNLLEV